MQICNILVMYGCMDMDLKILDKSYGGPQACFNVYQFCIFSLWYAIMHVMPKRCQAPYCFVIYLPYKGMVYLCVREIERLL